ncbi:MAG: hypothetical protein IPJ88_09590 [Myxococcales bacterium]|nr:MAG: hypothetical protein IPJ88_09590 [Myxococcales bacterium]
MPNLVWSVLLTAVIFLLYGFEYDTLPDDNLIKNPWFHGENPSDSDYCQDTQKFWEKNTVSGGGSWGGSEKTQDPTDINCVVGGKTWTGHAIRWADQGSDTFYPNQDAKFWQVVGPVSDSEKQLNFHFLMVFHRMSHFRAQISGSSSGSGPWNVVWTPIDTAWTQTCGANGCNDCDGNGNRDCLWDDVTNRELGPFALSTTIATGYAYYKVEFLGNYPNPDNSATGDVGGKIARVYFSVGDPPPGSVGGEGPGGNGGVDGNTDGGISGGSDSGTSSEDAGTDGILPAPSTDGGCACYVADSNDQSTMQLLGWFFMAVLLRRCSRS